MIDAQSKGADPYEGGSGEDHHRRANGRSNGVRRERREQTRTALLGAAERLWAERGIHGASLDDIASAAGLTKGAVYSNFSGKTDLLLALLERWTAQLNGPETYAELRDPAVPPEERFERAGRAYARCLGGENARLLALMLMEFWLYGMRDYTAGWRVAEWYAERRTTLARNLREVDGLRAQERATLAVALDFGLALQHLLDPDRAPAELYSQGMRMVLGRALT
ncbi:helix-turn-helix domain-containing protein [Spirillospora sp. NPDC029432]|uniref:TetR/AcrR family transcriptional regulator n=1 Tax=Spirillospora sp. NPDC029432 TaxID=3154599 RepID=UPI0034514EE3